MIYKDFKGIKLSRLGMGNMRLPLVAGGADKDIDYAKAQEIIDYAMAHGVNYYDSAYVYHSGESERFMGRALKKYPRESYYMATKYLIGANADYKAVFAEQLEKLGAERIDFYLIHCLLDANADAYLGSGCIEYFLQMQKEGKIGYLGFSSHASPATLRKFACHHEWDFAQIQLNYYDWLFSSAKEEYEVLAERGIPVIAMESVRGGKLSQLSESAERLLKGAHPDWSVSSWAFRWLKRLPQLQLALSGMSSLAQIEDNAANYEKDDPLSDEDEKLLFQAAEIFRDSLVVPCTACRYCCGGCPAQINIPEVLRVYNSYKLSGCLPWVLNDLKKIESKGQSADCVACDACAEHCPQSIDIPKIMAEIAKATRQPHD